MRIYDSLLESDPVFQQKLAFEKAMERDQARKEALQTFRDTIVEIVRLRFPTLVEFAQQSVVPVQQFEELMQLNVRLATAISPEDARSILEGIKAS